jgi:hypothetical protein
MKRWMTSTLLATSIFFSACTSTTEYKNGKKFTFDDTEINTKLVYFCQNKPNFAPMLIRAEKAHIYFKKQNNKNVQILIDSVGDEKTKESAMLDFKKRASKLALKLHKKFSCTLVDSIEY